MKVNLYLFVLLLMTALGLQAQTIMNIHQNNGTVLQIPLNAIDSITYTNTNPGNLATISTTVASSIMETTAISGGNIINDGGSIITQRGVCFDTSPSPTTANTTIINGSSTGSFTSNLTGLIANTTYYVRAYATNSAGTAYGNEVSFTTTSGGGGIVTNPGAGVTFNGYTYSSIVLGNGQEWMAENLRTTSYANGQAIPNVTDDTQWNNLTTGAWVYLYNDSQYVNPYGKLYNWYAVTDGRNICPTGWHIPTDAEWSALINYLDPNADGGKNFNIAGGKMKSTGTQFWLSPNTGATNQSGFSGLPGGSRGSNGTFYAIGNSGYWWSRTESSNSDAWIRNLSYSGGYVMRNSSPKKTGLSVRCLKD